MKILRFLMVDGKNRESDIYYSQHALESREVQA